MVRSTPPLLRNTSRFHDVHLEGGMSTKHTNHRQMAREGEELSNFWHWLRGNDFRYLREEADYPQISKTNTRMTINQTARNEESLTNRWP